MKPIRTILYSLVALCSATPITFASELPACPTATHADYHNCFGTHVDADGGKYVGEWVTNKREGRGTAYYSNGSKYVGEWKADKEHGQGTYTFGSKSGFHGDKYVGEFKEGKRHGHGTYFFNEGDKYVGEHQDNEGNGEGTFFWANGHKDVGTFKDGFLNGFATRYDADGEIIAQGVWKNDELQTAENSPSTPPKPSDNKPSQNNGHIISASSGSGFAVSNDGYLVTNNHVIEGCQKVFVHHRGKQYETDVVSYDNQNDLALLKGNFQPDIVLPLTSDKPQLAQDVYVSGYPFGLNISSSVKVTKGIISSLTGIGNNLAEMQIDAALQSGNSGGPILDEYGNVVGVAVAKLDVKFALENFGAIPENTNFGVKANIVEALLDANGVNYQQGKAEKPSGAEFSNMLSNGTYYISCWMTLAQIEAMKTKKVMFSDLQ